MSFIPGPFPALDAEDIKQIFIERHSYILMGSVIQIMCWSFCATRAIPIIMNIRRMERAPILTCASLVNVGGGWVILIRNYSPLLLLDHRGGGAVEGDLDGSQRIVALMGHGLEIAGDSAVSLGVAEGSETAGDLLLDLGHADIALGAGVGEWGVGVAAVRSTSVSHWVSALRVWAARVSGTICAAMRCVAKARMPWPYCSGPGISSGKEPRLSARQRGQVVISASTVNSRVSNRMSTRTHRSWPYRAMYTECGGTSAISA